MVFRSRPRKPSSWRWHGSSSRIPHTLVLDEATSLLDPRAARHLERSLASVLRGRTVVAIAHRLHTVAIELARPLVYGAALSLAENSPDTARGVSAAKAAAADAALLAARSSLQTHGAIGFTQEHDLSLWLLRCRPCARRGAIRPCTADGCWRGS